MMRIALTLAGLTMLGACTTAGVNADVQSTWNALSDEVRRDYDAAFRDMPFDTGTVYVVANEHGDLHTYSLTPCRNGTHICGGSGRVGHVQRTPDYFVVTGAYRDRIFYLSPGGDGILTWRGINHDLAWN